MNLVTGARWRFSRDCAPAGSSGADLFVVCTSASLRGPTMVLALSAKGKRPLARLPKGYFAFEATLSPDHEYISANLSPGCGPSYSFLIPSRGGPAMPLGGGRRWSAKTPPSSSLGWTSDGRLVAFISRPASCESESRSGIYLVNPRTLRRTFIYPRADRMWNASRG
jgi:hypothetical protein